MHEQSRECCYPDYTWPLKPTPEVEHVKFFNFAAILSAFKRQFAFSGHNKIRGTILVAIGVATDNNRIGQPGTRRGTLRQIIGS